MRERSMRDPSLDILRGMAVAIMILVDAVPDSAVTPSLLQHSPWEGITVADLAFPGFVFTMGASAAFSVRRPYADWTGKILRRTLLLFAIGLLINTVPELFHWILSEEGSAAMFYDRAVIHGRIPGILQRLALTYAFGMILILWLKEDLRLISCALCLLVLSSLGFHLYAPDAPFDKMHNISQAVDLILPGENHVYPYYGLPFDPEGLYGTLASTASMLFGVLAGRVLADSSFSSHKVRLLLLGGAALFLLGLLWSRIDLIGKPLWTAPFALLNAGGAMLMLAFLVWTRKIFPKAENLLHPFYAFGRNPLFFFLISNVALIFLFTLRIPSEDINAYQWLWLHTTRGIISLPFSAALHMFLWCLLWVPLAEFLCRKNIIIKL